MEMIATAKAVSCQRKIEAVQPYGDKVQELLADLKQSGVGADELAAKFPLLRIPDKVRRESVWILTANRGLCGGYNTNCLRLAEQHLRELGRQGVEAEIMMVGKKGAARFRYLGIETDAEFHQFEDRPTWEEAEEVFSPTLEAYAEGRVDRVSIFSTRYINAARQRPEHRVLLPLQSAETQENSTEFIFEPSPEEILDTLVPAALKINFYQALVEAAASEQIARRIAMKNATDNAGDMVREYTQLYNRTRQAGITQEILEIVGGAQAME